MPVGFFPTNPVVAGSIGAFNQNAQAGLSNYNDNATREAIAQIQARQQMAAQQMDQQRIAQQQALQQQQLAQQGFFGRSDAEFRNRELAARERMAIGQGAARSSENALDRAASLEAARIQAGSAGGSDAKMAMLDATIDEKNNEAEVAAARLNQQLEINKRLAEKLIEDTFKTESKAEWFGTGKSTAKRDEALKSLRESNYLPAVSEVLKMHATDPVASQSVIFDGTKFVARKLAKRGAATGGTSTGQFFPPSALPENPNLTPAPIALEPSVQAAPSFFQSPAASVVAPPVVQPGATSGFNATPSGAMPGGFFQVPVTTTGTDPRVEAVRRIMQERGVDANMAARIYLDSLR